jgi:uncharacterized protein YbaR (Trm112 family)
MKPWLFDILACPIDKHFPLKLFIFSFENKPEEFKSIIEIYQKKDIERIKKENIIQILKENGDLFLKDNIIIERNNIKNYIHLILSSINELDNIEDKSLLDISKNCFNLIKTDIKTNILRFSNELKIEKLDEIFPDLYFLNKMKLEIEIETGILYCEKCHRWYPIIDTIPQMLPDEYRDSKEIEFLKTNKNLLDQEFLNQDLKPFKI